MFSPEKRWWRFVRKQNVCCPNELKSAVFDICRSMKKEVNNNYKVEGTNRLIVTKWNKMRQKVLDEGKALEMGYFCKRKEHLHTCVIELSQIRMCVQRTCVKKWLKPSCICWQVHTPSVTFNKIQELKNSDTKADNSQIAPNQ